MSSLTSSPSRRLDQDHPLPPFLLALAPGPMPNHRKVRYLGDHLCVPLERLAEQDQASLRSLYLVLTELLGTMTDTATDDARKWQEVTRWLQRHSTDSLIEEIRALGIASCEQAPGEATSKAMHDVRGGALSSLLGRLQLLDRLPRNESQMKTLFVLTRDHLKIMRNAVTGLDEARRNADRRPKAHDINLMLDKWQDSVVGPNWSDRPIRMDIDCRCEGPLTECCLESAALDRIFYNLAANAARYSAGDRLDMVVFPLPESAGDCLRFVLSNEVSVEDAETLRALIPEDQTSGAAPGGAPNIPVLFQPGGSGVDDGFGLMVVADFVTEAFGLTRREEALRQRLVGATIDGQTFRVWFHWPPAHEGLPPKLDDYHRPQQSLSEP